MIIGYIILPLMSKSDENTFEIEYLMNNSETILLLKFKRGLVESSYGVLGHGRIEY